jgi:arylsulfatase A-like enzyme
MLKLFLAYLRRSVDRRHSATVIGRALSWGTVYWGFYAAVDYCLSDVLPPLLRPAQYVPDSSYWNAGVTALIAMVLGGAIVGAAAGLFWNSVANQRASDPGEAKLAGGACFSVIAVFAGVVGAKTSRGVLPLVLALAVPATMAAVVLWASLNERRARQFWFLTNPATITLALLVRPWLYQDILSDSSQRWQMIASASALVLIVACSWVLDRIGRGGKVEVEGWSSVRWIRSAALLLGVLSIAGGFVIRSRQHLIAAGDAANAAGKPNIILIVMDTVRADHTSLYGYDRDTTPNLRRLAAESTLYRNAISAANWTTPSHASIFTGMYTLRHGVRYKLPDNTLNRLPEAVPTLAEVLAHQDYRTAGLVANHGFLSDSLGFGRGFGFYRLAMPWLVFERSRYPSVLRSVRHRLLPPADKSMTFVKGEKITADALGILDQLAGRQPFFLFLNYMDAHWPYTPLQPFDSRFEAPSRHRTNEEYTELARDVNGGERVVTEAERRDLVGGYDGGIAYLDQQLGILFDALRRARVYDRALIIVTSDHGEAFGAKSFLGHGTSVYQDQVRVPLLIKFPKQREPAEETVLVSGVDLYPTVMEAAGAPLERYLAGVPLQRASGGIARAVFAESYPDWSMRTNLKLVHRIQRAMFRDGWKLILFTDGGRELYDLSTDSGENKNVIAEQPRLAAEMEAVLSAWQKNLAPVNGPKGIDKDTLDRLKSLGYVQ